MKAVILAAGVARRLYPITYQNPKCLLEINGKAIIDYQLQALSENDITDATVVVGYFHEKVVDHLENNYPDFSFNFIVNDHFFETNTAYSLYLCSDLLGSSSNILLNADVLFPTDLLRRVISTEFENVLAVDIKSCGREEVKVIAGMNNQIVAIGKEIIQENALGEFVGVAKLSRDFSNEFARSLVRLIDAGGKADYFEAAVQPLLSTTQVHFVDISDLPCIEIDFAEDLEEARVLAYTKWFLN